MIQFETPAVVPADPEANVTDLLVDRVAATPDSRPVLPPHRRRRLARRHDRASSTTRSSPSRRASSPRASSPATRSASCARPRYEWTLIDFAAVVRRRRAGADLRDQLPRADPVEPHRLRRHRDHPRDARPLRPLRRGARRAPADPQRLADRPRRPRQARRIGARTSPTRRSSAAATSRSAPTSRRSSTRRARPASPRAACSPTRTSSSSAATPPWRSRRSCPSPARRRCCSSRPRTSSRASSRCSTIHAGVKRRPPARHEAAAAVRSARFKPTFLLAVPRVFEKVYNSAEQKAEAGGKGKIFRAAADVAVAHSKALRTAGKVPFGLKLKFALFDRLVYSKLRAAMGGNVEVRRLGLRAARPAPRPLLPQPRHHDPRGLRPHRDHGARHREPRDEVQDRHRRPRAPRRRPCASPTTARSRSRASTSSRSTGSNPEATAETFDGDWFKTGDIGAFDDDGLPHDHRPQEGDHRHRRRQERRPGRARGPDPRQPDRRPGRRRRRPEAVHLGAHHARPRDAARRGSTTTARTPTCRSTDAAKQPRGARRGAAGDRRRERERLARRVDPQVHDPRDRAHRGERPPDAEDEHQAQRHPRGLRRRDRGDVLGAPATEGHSIVH